jgi:3-hydroxy-9,10-secoandrosta-1,3,5(10)-triene-9,17-dione monooxygenase reductase component
MHDSTARRELRGAFGRFATGVTIATARAPGGQPVGVTVNSFTSVSLDPPLILWSLARKASSLPIFLGGSHFAVNVLSEEQHSLSERFATPVENRFEGVDWSPGMAGVPLLSGCIAIFECLNAKHIEAGDHTLFLGSVQRYRCRTGAPLLFFASRYGALRQPHEAVAHEAA